MCIRDSIYIVCTVDNWTQVEECPVQLYIYIVCTVDNWTQVEECPVQLIYILCVLQITGPKLKSAQHVTEEKWLQQVAKAAEKSVDLKEEIEQLKVNYTKNPQK